MFKCEVINLAKTYKPIQRPNNLFKDLILRAMLRYVWGA